MALRFQPPPFEEYQPTGFQRGQQISQGLNQLGDTFRGLALRRDDMDRQRKQQEMERLMTVLKLREMGYGLAGVEMEQNQPANQLSLPGMGQNRAQSPIIAAFNARMGQGGLGRQMPRRDQIQTPMGAYERQPVDYGGTVQRMQTGDFTAYGDLYPEARKETRDIYEFQQRQAEARQRAEELAQYRADMMDLRGREADIKQEKADAKQEQMEKVETSKTNAALGQANRIIAKVDQAIAKVSPLSAGLGSYTAGIPLTPARNLQADLQTIKANLGFAELQAMRAASPTGGALGQVAVQELDALQSTIASLDQAQSPEQLTERLSEVKQHYENWKKTLQPNNAQSVSGFDSNGLSEKRRRLEELRRKRDQGVLR